MGSRRAGLHWVKPYGDARKAPENANALIHDLVLRITLIAHELQIPKSLIINSDQSGFHFMQTRGNTWAEVETVDTEAHGPDHRPKRAEVKVQGINDKRQGTGTVSTSMSGATLPGQLILAGVAHSSAALPTLEGNVYQKWDGQKAGEKVGFELVQAPGSAAATGQLMRTWLGHLTQTPTHWSDIPTSYAILDRVIVPHLLKVKHDLGLSAEHPSILLVDTWYGWCKQDQQRKHQKFPDYVKQHYPWLKLLFVPNACTDLIQPADRGMISWLKARMRHFYSEHMMSFVLRELKAGKQPDQIKIDVSAPTMKRLLASSFAKALSELPADKVRQCWFELQKAFPSDNPDHAELLEEARANRARLFPSGDAPQPLDTDVTDDPDPASGEGDMDEPDNQPPTPADMNALFDAATRAVQMAHAAVAQAQAGLG